MKNHFMSKNVWFQLSEAICESFLVAPFATENRSFVILSYGALNSLSMVFEYGNLFYKQILKNEDLKRG